MLTDQSTIDVIKKSRKQITILFSDIESSTRHWERRGDVDARILIDRHNRLLFPVIRKFKGRVIKTLGDSIMASFKDADNAVKAAIAMQQVLKRERQKDKYFSLHCRIGLHTGKGIVEYDDIYGDVVNVAAKVQAEAQGDQIYLTQSTLARLKESQLHVQKVDSIRPKGKRKPIEIMELDWPAQPSLIHDLREDALLPLLKRQKFEILSYFLVTIGTLFFLYQHYLRYILSEKMQNISRLELISYLPSDYLPLLFFSTLLLGSFSIYMFRIDFISRSFLRILSGLFTFGLVLMLFHFINSSVQPPFNKRWYEPIYQSKTRFVEVLVKNTLLREQPNSRAKIISLLPAGEIFIYKKSVNKQKRRWDQVQLDKDHYAWIAHRIPPAFGVAEQQLTQRHAFTFHYYDLYGLILGFIAFLWGFMSFRIHPN